MWYLNSEFLFLQILAATTSAPPQVKVGDNMENVIHLYLIVKLTY